MPPPQRAARDAWPETDLVEQRPGAPVEALGEAGVEEAYAESFARCYGRRGG
jgi:hypothetical protein